MSSRLARLVSVRHNLPHITLTQRLALSLPTEKRRLRVAAGDVLIALAHPSCHRTGADVIALLLEELSAGDPSSVWLTLSVLRGELATQAEVVQTVRAIELDGADRALAAAVAAHAPGRNPVHRIRVVTGDVLVDMEHTARTGLATGIQRVARETARRWARDHDVRLVGWTTSHRQLRLLTPAEAERALTGSTELDSAATQDDVVVPFRSTYLLPELSTEGPRNERIAAMARFGRNRTGVIGFDCVPMSTAETTAQGVSEAFAGNLAAVRHMDRLSAISATAGKEYAGWERMLPSIGAVGPRIGVDLLPAEVPDSSPAALEEARRLLTLPGMPMVLCVGSHEPRKNHLALLHAAELVWRQGIDFNLVMLGGRAWNDEAFVRALAEARGRNRPIDTPQSMSDQLLWAAYRLARCTAFPSVNEGFGLPVAESLACGTPVITSGYGSMAEIAAGGGALLVDPRDDHDIAAALRTLLTDDSVHQRLSFEARARSSRTWDDYARDVWATLTGHPPGSATSWQPDAWTATT